ncbi:MAG TPA: hypothetical protein VKC11_00620 [Steroidobacteraceae bacterium]|nr:hypothetical protein [Steroidobacteraceae bacterium]
MLPRYDFTPLPRQPLWRAGDTLSAKARRTYRNIVRAAFGQYVAAITASDDHARQFYEAEFGTGNQLEAVLTFARKPEAHQRAWLQARNAEFDRDQATRAGALSEFERVSGEALASARNPSLSANTSPDSPKA